MQSSVQQRAATPKVPSARVGLNARRVVRVQARKEAGAALASTLMSTVALVPGAQAAAEVASNADAASIPFALGGGVAIAGLGALLVATDPQNR
eukprot:1159339-Pelagomonas_calceolata.AAC.6